MRVAPSGGAAEDLVARTLADAGWEILGRRLRVGRLEIDILAKRGDVIAVVEVRGRRLDGMQSPFDSIDAGKRARLIEAARRIWARFADDRSVRLVRIDLAAVTWRPDAEATLEIVEGCVDLEG